MLTLGPMPESVREAVRQLVDEAGQEYCGNGGRFLGYLLTGGPGGCDFLDADGEVRTWWVDETIEAVPDGPRKVGSIAIAAKRVPALAAWLPRRPPAAIDCKSCLNGWYPPTLSHLLCPTCSGMEWLAE